MSSIHCDDTSSAHHTGSRCRRACNQLHYNTACWDAKYAQVSSQNLIRIHNSTPSNTPHAIGQQRTSQQAMLHQLGSLGFCQQYSLTVGTAKQSFILKPFRLNCGTSGRKATLLVAPAQHTTSSCLECLEPELLKLQQSTEHNHARHEWHATGRLGQKRSHMLVHTPYKQTAHCRTKPA